MDISVLVLQIVTILVSVTSLIVSFTSTLVENKKKNYIKVVTEQRLKNKDIVRKSVADLLCVSHPCILAQFDENTMKNCCAHASDVESILRRFYKEDQAVLQSIDQLLDLLQQWLTKSTTAEEVERARKALLYEYSVYDFADWQFIKSQSSGKQYSSDDFDEIYAQSRERFSNN